MRIKLLTLLILSIWIGFSYADSAFAHEGEGSARATSGRYSIDVDYDPVGIEAGKLVNFDFAISETATESPASFTSVNIEISQGNETKFAGKISPTNAEQTGMAYVFPRSGEYNMRVEFMNGVEKIAEADLPFMASASEAAPESRSSANIVSGVIGALIGLIVGYSFHKK